MRLRRGLVWGVVFVVVGLAVLVAVHALTLLPVDLRFAHIGLKGTRITIDSPKLVGYRQDGRPYELHARTGVQDLSTPDVFELEGVDVRVETGATDSVMLTAGGALYNAKTDRADLAQSVRIFDAKSFDLTMSRAVMDFKAGALSSDRSATLKLEKVTITADSAEFSQGERRMSFAGRVHTLIEGEEDDAGKAAVDARE